METEDEIPGAEQAERLADELDRLIDYFAAEFRMPLATAIGVLQIKVHAMIQEASED
jgi:hypothetical protein